MKRHVRSDQERQPRPCSVGREGAPSRHFLPWRHRTPAPQAPARQQSTHWPWCSSEQPGTSHSPTGVGQSGRRAGGRLQPWLQRCSSRGLHPSPSGAPGPTSTGADGGALQKHLLAWGLPPVPTPPGAEGPGTPAPGTSASEPQVGVPFPLPPTVRLPPALEDRRPCGALRPSGQRPAYSSSTKGTGALGMMPRAPAQCPPGQEGERSRAQAW